MSSQPRRNVIQCVFGAPATRPPADDGCWIYSEGRILIDLAKKKRLLVEISDLEQASQETIRVIGGVLGLV